MKSIEMFDKLIEAGWGVLDALMQVIDAFFDIENLDWMDNIPGSGE